MGTTKATTRRSRSRSCTPRSESAQPVADLREHLVVHGDLTADEALALDEKFQEKLKKAQDEVKKTPVKKRGMPGFTGRWQGLRPRYSFVPVPTAVPFDTLREITDRISQMPMVSI